MKKQKISVIVSADTIAWVDQVAGSNYSRSAVIDRVLQCSAQQRTNANIAARDLRLINAAAGRLNREAARVLEYQVRSRPAK